MAAPILPAPPSPETAEFPLLGIFAVLIVVATVAIGFLLAAPSILTLVLALVTVIGFAASITYVLARIIGEE